MHSKSILGQILLERAWQQAVTTGDTTKAWPWADTWPVAKLQIQSTGRSLVILEGVSGEAMAFGPGRIIGSSSSAASGTYVVGGHRDSHLAFLEHINNDDLLELQTIDGESMLYKVVQQTVANQDEASLTVNPEVHGLILITCYPFNAFQTGGPLRYIVMAEPV